MSKKFSIAGIKMVYSTPVRIAKQPKSFIVQYVENEFYVKHNGDLIPIVYDNEIFNDTSYLYAKPSNKIYDNWFIHKHGKIKTRLDLTAMWWSPIYPGMRVRGEIVKKTFILNNDYLNQVGETNYNKYIDASKKTK